MRDGRCLIICEVNTRFAISIVIGLVFLAEKVLAKPSNILVTELQLTFP
jgi:hypothetical protein